ncbi:MAG: TraB/GumN family protein [Candidatus Undinarchaeales archaeon]
MTESNDEEKKEAGIEIIGVSHISPESIKDVEARIKKEKPDCVAVELDRNRFEALRKGEKISISAVKYIGFRNYLLAKIMSAVQEYLGKKTGVIPGEEMLSAVKAGHMSGAEVVLIDRNLKVTLDRLKTISFREKIGLFFSIFKKIKIENFDLRKVPPERVIEKIIEQIKETSPGLYRVMIEERNEYMAKVLSKLKKRHSKIIVVVGAGHKKGLEQKLKNLNS